MASYLHKAFPTIEDSDYVFNEALNDNAYTNLVVFFRTRDNDTGRMYESRHVVELPPIDPEKYILAENLTERILLDWVEEHGDVIAMQDYNVGILLEAS
jgi:hypothetical protein